MSLFLEISSVGSACGKNFFEPIERTLICGWARRDKNAVLKFLINSECIKVSETESDDEQMDIEKELSNIYNEHSEEVKDPSEFKGIEDVVVSELKKRKNVSDVQVEKVKATINDNLKKDTGKNNEIDVIKNNNYKPGNSKMYYHSIGQNKIGGFHDASDGDMVIEIKTRMSLRNVRKNEYDLYQLFGYLVAMKLTRGKIVQKFGGKIFASDTETDNEYGIVDVTQEPWKNKVHSMLSELEEYFKELSNVIKTNTINIEKCVPKNERPIAIILTGKGFCDINPKFNKLLKFLN